MGVCLSSAVVTPVNREVVTHTRREPVQPQVAADAQPKSPLSPPGRGNPPECMEPVCFSASPIVVECTAGTTYFYCTCGLSENQPFCDGSHVGVKDLDGAPYVPEAYRPAQSGPVSFCGCRTSKSGAVCDGSHVNHPEYNMGASRASQAQCEACPNRGEIGDIEDIESTRPKVAQKGPYKVAAEKGNVFYYCSCGRSKNQPFCDATHQSVNEKHGTSFAPIMHEAAADGNISFCGCRTSRSAPICDGSHRALLAEGSVSITSPRALSPKALSPSHRARALSDCGRDASAEFDQFSVQDVQAINHDTRIITARAQGKARQVTDVSFHFSVRIASGMVRPYTPIAYDPTSGTVALLVKVVDGGAVSPVLGELTAGSSVELRGPSPGAFLWRPAEYKTVLLLAAGSGITPVFQIMKVACEDSDSGGNATTVRLMYSNKTEADILLRSELEQARQDFPQVMLSLDLCVTREAAVGEPLVAGRIGEALLKSRMPAELEGFHAVVSGTPDFNVSICNMLKACGASDLHITVC
eukprot:TRINITY_DN18_c25_g1_i1.p1 TRINITY_DN18_c25_g1~~TRINITY_DN18_c25_g1_i1.p1  ORF type:complete len:526 (+),score=116.09 TRINITY_DN18_c25_g1_i1:112-1689(+)